MLTRYGARFAVGSDMYGSPARREVDALRRLGVWDDRALLKIWYETPRTIFPGRKIGALAEDFEASFLALDRNPLDDFDAVRTIGIRVKQGCLLDR